MKPQISFLQLVCVHSAEEKLNVSKKMNGEKISGVKTLQAAEPPYSVSNGPIKNRF